MAKFKTLIAKKETKTRPLSIFHSYKHSIKKTGIGEAE
jgi:hypothetical protein